MTICLLHISDSHLYADETARLKGICPHDSFAAVVDHAHAWFPTADAVILGGDMAQDEQPETYSLLGEMLSCWQTQFMISPGNHACMDHLNARLIPVLNRHGSYSDACQLGAWQLITLNSHHAGHVPGLLSESELQHLQDLLGSSTAEHSLVALHHHPIPVGSRWMDNIILKNRMALWEIAARFPQLKVMLCGHIHQAFDSVYQQVRVLGSPSTCIQFTPGQDTFALDNQSPGYRWLELHDDGSIATGINRITGFIPADLNNTDPY